MKKTLFFTIIAMALLGVGCSAGNLHIEYSDTISVEQARPQDSEEYQTEKIIELEQDVPINSKPQEDSPLSPLYVEGTTLFREDGTPIQLRGISSHGLSWFPQFVNIDAMKQMKDEWGCNVFRLAMYSDDYNGYCSGDEANKETLKALIDAAVYASKELDMYIIIDWHILSDYNPLTHQDEAMIFFREVAEKYKEENHIIYEICNEPNGDTSWNDIKQYAQAIIPIIRASTDAVVLVGTPTWSQDVDVAASDPLAEFSNIMYTLHFYAATHRQELRTRMEQALQLGLPIFVSEFGICDASGNGITDEAEAERWIEFLNRHGISYVMWNLSNKAEASAMIAATCAKTSGFTNEDLSPTGRWFVNMFGNKLPVSEINVPDRGENDVEKESGAAVQLTLVNSWDAEGKRCYQYTLSLQNTTTSDISPWQTTVEFNQNIALVNGWNAKFAIDGMTLTITPMDYNKLLAQMDAISDIGFILESDIGLTVQNKPEI